MADVVDRLNEAHGKLLTLHKALIEWERRRYEKVHGTVESPYAMLNLLINDPQFAWLRRMSEVIVQIDEYTSSKEPVTAEAGEAILGQVRALVSGEGDGEFARNYREAMEGDPEVAGLHEQVKRAAA